MLHVAEMTVVGVNRMVLFDQIDPGGGVYAVREVGHHEEGSPGKEFHINGVVDKLRARLKWIPDEVLV